MKKISLFKAVGVELEYMIVDSSSLNVKPLCDEVLMAVNGAVSCYFENGSIAWSNELVAHVIELKTNGPAVGFDGLADAFHQNVLKINAILAPYNAVLMPTGAHPWMNPDTDTVLWPHESNEIYSLYHRIFNCKGHGWSNLQSMHLNLPFSGDVEFHALHSAVRLLLPLMPALTASTPVLDGVETGFVDSRLEHYRFNQQKIPCIAGRIIPEEVASKADYQLTIYNPIAQAIKPYDNQGLLKQHFLNSRGAIARFDRSTIEIRILDLQEAPLVDLALAKFIFEVIRYLVSLRLTQTGHAHSISTDYLADVFEQVIKVGDVVEVLDTNHLLALGFGGADKHTVNEIWMTYFTRVSSSLTPLEIDVVRLVLEQGCLSTRIKKALHLDASLTHQHLIYQQLIQCLVSNKPFVGIG